MNFDTLTYISEQQPKQMDKCRLVGGELIVVRTGVNTGDCAVVPTTLRNAYAGYDLILTFKCIALSKFVSAFLDTEIGRLQLNLVKGRAAQPHVNAEEVRAIRLPIPQSKETLDRLVANVDMARTVRREKLARADELFATMGDFFLVTIGINLPPHEPQKVFAIQSRDLGRRIDAYSNQLKFRKLFAYIKNSRYPAPSLRKLATRIFSGTTPLAKGDAYVPPPKGIRFIRSGEITDNGEVTPRSDIHINERVHNGIMRRSQLQRGDLLVAIVGATIGAAGVFQGDEPANINQAIAAVRLKHPEVSPEFVCLYLRSSIGQALLDYFKRPVARANINLEEIGEIPIIVPPIHLQEIVIAESHRRYVEWKRLRAEAEVGWQAAKRSFEEQLLPSTGSQRSRL